MGFKYFSNLLLKIEDNQIKERERIKEDIDSLNLVKQNSIEALAKVTLYNLFGNLYFIYQNRIIYLYYSE